MRNGDVVTLVGGGPKMTVTSTDGEPGWVFCTWFDEDKVSRTRDFHVDSLRTAKPEWEGASDPPLIVPYPIRGFDCQRIEDQLNNITSAVVAVGIILTSAIFLLIVNFLK